MLARYDELAALLASVEDRPVGEPSATARATAVLHREARLLDLRRFDRWLDGFTTDAVVWVPLTAPAHPATDQSLYLDDRRRLAERVKWHQQPTAWGQHPPSSCTRAVSTVEAWSAGDGIVAHSTVTVVERRHGCTQLVAGRHIHELVGAALRCRSKIIVLPDLATGVRNPSFVL